MLNNQLKGLITGGLIAPHKGAILKPGVDRHTAPQRGRLIDPTRGATLKERDQTDD